MKIQIYGSGCDKCRILYSNAEAALRDSSMTAELEKVTEMEQIVAAGILMTPALVIDGRIMSQGKVLGSAEILALLDPGLSSIPTDKKMSKSCSCGGRGKRFFSGLLLCFVVFSVFFMIFREMTAKNTSSDGVGQLAESAGVVKENAVTVYYFHGAQRCFTCNTIEALTRKAIDDAYSAGLKAGDIVFRSINLDDAVNAHFVDDFELSVRGVVMKKGNRVKKFDEVWTWARDSEKMTHYIKDGVAEMLR